MFRASRRTRVHTPKRRTKSGHRGALFWIVAVAAGLWLWKWTTTSNSAATIATPSITVYQEGLPYSLYFLRATYDASSSEVEILAFAPSMQPLRLRLKKPADTDLSKQATMATMRSSIRKLSAALALGCNAILARSGDSQQSSLQVPNFLVYCSTDAPRALS